MMTPNSFIQEQGFPMENLGLGEKSISEQDKSLLEQEDKDEAKKNEDK